MTARRLLDPRWHWLRSAAERIYADLDPGDKVLGVSVMIQAEDGIILAGLVNMPGGGVFRRLVTNEDVAAGVAVDVLGATTDLLPDQEFLP